MRHTLFWDLTARCELRVGRWKRPRDGDERPRLSNLVEKAMMRGELNQLDSIRNPHLVENVREM
jgi:hypothetical protein